MPQHQSEQLGMAGRKKCGLTISRASDTLLHNAGSHLPFKQQIGWIK
jgi:hypothetical protein